MPNHFLHCYNPQLLIVFMHLHAVFVSIFNHLKHTCTEVASVVGINQLAVHHHYLEGKFVFTSLIKMVGLTIKRIAVSFVEVCWARV